MRHELTFAATPFRGPLVAVHRLRDRQALCWARHGECDPRCDCRCACASGSPLGACEEPPNSTCAFECPPRSVLLDELAGAGEAPAGRQPKEHEAAQWTCTPAAL